MADGIAKWNFSERVVVVTNAGSPRGGAEATAFAAAGATVLACGVADQRVADLGSSFKDGRIEAVEVDLTAEAAVVEFAKRIDADHGRLDVLVVNDGIAADSPLVDVSIEEWSDLVAESLDVPFLCAKHLTPLMFPAKYGKIVLTTGPESSAGQSGRAHVCAARHAIVGFAKDLAIESAQYQVNVNVAEGGGEVDQAGSPEAVKSLVHAVLWLSSDAARFVTGTVVRGHEAPVGLPL